MTVPAVQVDVRLTEHLVVMTTEVPDGTSDAEVADMRKREAVRAGELADQGHLLRLWRPPLRPGEWRTIGLFAAEDGDDLETVLASMPLRAWRTEVVTPLAPHPNDPGTLATTPDGQGIEFLTDLVLNVPPGTPPGRLRSALADEAQSARSLAQQGHLLRLWTLPSSERAPVWLGLWSAGDEAGLVTILQSLPLGPWLSVTTTSLSGHPSDPAGYSG